jgi:hypothetical protein
MQQSSTMSLPFLATYFSGVAGTEVSESTFDPLRIFILFYEFSSVSGMFSESVLISNL